MKNQVSLQDFDLPADRREVPALRHHRNVIGEDDDSVFAASVADMDFRAPPCVRDAMARRLKHGIFGYETVPDGLIPALTDWLDNRHGWSVDPDWILRAPNVLNALAHAVRLFTSPGEGILVQPPVFFDFFDIIRDTGRRLVANDLVLRNGRYEMDFDDLARKAADPSVRMILLCNPHNPVGRVWTPQELNTLGQICLERDVLVVSDEIHADITYPGHRYTPYASLGPVFADNAIVCLSPAKAFNIAACCSAFTCIPEAGKRSALDAENRRMTVNKNNAFANVAMESAYREGAAWLDDLLHYLQGNLALMASEFESIPGVTLVRPEGSFLAWVDFRGLGMAPDALHQFLKQEVGWVVSRGTAFGDAGAGFVRVNFACRRARLSWALDRLRQLVTQITGQQLTI